MVKVEMGDWVLVEGALRRDALPWEAWLRGLGFWLDFERMWGC
ncbi:MAG: hypothetical protein ACJAXZ_000261 [Akkermansiaceae bacterium]|jgi:hypothetical protein